MFEKTILENTYMETHRIPFVLVTRWAYHAKNSSWYTLLKYPSPSMVHPIFENFDRKMVVVPSRLWLPLLHPWLSRTAGWGASLLHCVQGPCASTAPWYKYAIGKFIPHFCMSNQGHTHLNPPPINQTPPYSVWVYTSECTRERQKKRKRERVCV